MGKRDNRVVSNAGSPAGKQQQGPGRRGGRRWDPPQPRRRHLRAGPGEETVGSWALPQPGQPHCSDGLGWPVRPAPVLRSPGTGRRGPHPTAGEKAAPEPSGLRRRGRKTLEGWLVARHWDWGRGRARGPCRQTTQAGRAQRSLGCRCRGPVWDVPQRGLARARGSLAEPPTALSNPAAVVTDACFVFCSVKMIKMLLRSL